jgi:hypothetical protein
MIDNASTDILPLFGIDELNKKITGASFLNRE